MLDHNRDFSRGEVGFHSFPTKLQYNQGYVSGGPWGKAESTCITITEHVVGLALVPKSCILPTCICLLSPSPSVQRIIGFLPLSRSGCSLPRSLPPPSLFLPISIRRRRRVAAAAFHVTRPPLPHSLLARVDGRRHRHWSLRRSFDRYYSPVASSAPSFVFSA